MIRRMTQATENVYSTVLEDLKSDKKFKESDYPKQSGDHSLKVIQIAESVSGELFVYVYQPSGKCTATSINLSTAINDSLKYSNYKLTRLSADGVFGKYLVEELTVKKDALRYYDISAIYRNWDSRYDNPTTGATSGQTVSEVAYSVGQQWTATTLNGNVAYEMTEIETIKVTEQYVGFRRYSNGVKFNSMESCDGHFVAFTADHEMDRIISADLEFDVQRYGQFGGSTDYYETERKAVTLYDYEKAGNEGGLFDDGKYIWDRISSTTDYINDMKAQGVEMEEDELRTFGRYEWILNFYETPYESGVGGRDVLISLLIPGGFIWSICNGITKNGYLVSNVVLLRLEFETDNVIYNLGVVGNKQTGSRDPIGEEKSWFGKTLEKLGDIPWWGWVIIGVVAILLLCMIKPVFELVVFLLKGIVWIVTLPFRAIGAVFKNIGDHREKNKRKKAKKIKKSEEIHEEEGS